MNEKTYTTPLGVIHYWVHMISADDFTLVFLPGLTADHRLFEKQIWFFEGKYNVFVWDAPAHAASWPFTFDFDLMDKARWLDGILEQEGITMFIHKYGKEKFFYVHDKLHEVHDFKKRRKY